MQHEALLTQCCAPCPPQQEVNADPERRAEQWFYANWLRSSWFKALSTRAKQVGSQPGASETVSAEEQQLLSAKANPNLFEPSFRTPTPNFFSLDNPILATVAGLMIVGVVSTLLFGQ